MKSQGNATIRVGTAGWSYEDWKGIVYPPGIESSSHPLRFLSGFFDVIEVNSSFYRPPQARHAARWVELVADNPRFMFTFKLWERFTHKRDSWPSQDESSEFRRGIKPVFEAGKLGAILIQFPWSFKRTRENRLWLGRTLETFADYPLALEIRHASWDRKEVYAGLSERGVAFCNIDQPLFNDSLGPTEHVTNQVGYVRLHGQNVENWFREDAGRDDRYDYLYSHAELAEWIARVERISEKVKDVYVITNNHYRGQAVVNAFELQRAFRDDTCAPPENLVKAYPRLAASAQERAR